MATEIRPACAADGPAIDRVRRESWFAAHAGIIDGGLIDRATAARPAGEPPPYLAPAWWSAGHGRAGRCPGTTLRA